MVGLLDLYEREFFSDLFALTNLGKRISGNQEILINYTSSNLVYTDGRFINLPSRFKTDISTSQGLVAHESGHIGYGSFELAFQDLIKVLAEKYDFPHNYIKMLINVVEDVRIDAINEKKFPGFYENLRNFNLKLLPEIKSKMERNRDLLTYVYLFMENFQEFKEKPKFRGISFKDSDWKAIRAVTKLLRKALTPNASIITCDQICKVLKKYITFKKPKPVQHSRRSVHNPGSRDAYFSEEINPDEFNIRDAFEYREAHDNVEELNVFEDSEIDGKIEQVIDQIPIITNSIADFNEKGEIKSKLDETSDNMVDKIKDLDLKTEDIEQLIDNIDSVEDKHQNEYNSADNDSILSDFCNNIEIDDNELGKEKYDDLKTEKINDLIKEIEELTELSKINLEEIDNNEVIEKLDKLSKEIEYNKNKDEFETEWEIKNDEIKKLIREIESLEEEQDENKKYERKKEILDELEEIFIQFENISEENQKTIENMEDIEMITEMIVEASKAMNERYIFLEGGGKNGNDRQIIETNIENEEMLPKGLKFKEIQNKFVNIIQKLKRIFCDLKNDSDLDTFQKVGRLNNKFIKTVTSNYKFKKCFTKKIKQKELKILVMVDISGSMEGKKMESAKIAMVMLCEALKDIAKIRIVLFTGDYDARNILVKDFGEIVNSIKFDKFGRHIHDGNNLDGISIKNEAKKLNKNEIIVVISDGRPAGGGGYGLNDAIHEIHDVTKRFKVFAFSIDAQGEHLNKLYGDNWILTSSINNTDLSEKLITFCRLLVKEFYR